MTNHALAATPDSFGRFGPYVVTVPVLMIILGLYSQVMSTGLLGIVGLAAAGLLWALLTGFIASRAIAGDAWRVRLANASVFLSIVVTGLLSVAD